ncbi:MAG: hypothetical protein IT374_26680 [Polyangiaceae bacterium]|nr:hypothetical protein [Polyangiaceae bacterium]
MAPTLRSLLCYSLALAGCAPGPLGLSTRTTDERAPRRPDAVVADPPSAPPPAAGPADTRAGIVALTASAGEGARELVTALGAAITKEDAVALAACLASDATWSNPSGGRGGLLALDVLRERFRKLDYTKWAGGALFADDEAEVLTYDDFDALPARGPRPPEMRSGDVLVRGRVVSPRAGYERLFGDELTLLARPAGGRLRIVLILEDFPLA